MNLVCYIVSTFSITCDCSFHSSTRWNKCSFYIRLRLIFCSKLWDIIAQEFHLHTTFLIYIARLYVYGNIKVIGSFFRERKYVQSPLLDCISEVPLKWSLWNVRNKCRWARRVRGCLQCGQSLGPHRSFISRNTRDAAWCPYLKGSTLDPKPNPRT